MPKTKPAPSWVHYRPRQHLLELVSVSWSAELAHRRFADYHWSTGLWPQAPPADGPALARVAPTAWPGLVRELRRLGWRPRGRRLVCRAVAAVRAQAVRACAHASTAGTAGANARWRQSKVMAGAIATPLPAQCDRNPTAMQIKMKIKNKKKDIKRLTAERLTGEASPEPSTRSPVTHEKASVAEKTFLRELAETFESFRAGTSNHELTNWGGWWRNRYRENPDKAQRVLAEIRSMIRERTIRGNPGAGAVDLWKRLP